MQWYVSYKLEFMTKFESHCKDIRNGRKSRHTSKKILELLDGAVLDAPTTPEFLGIRLIFMDFAKIMNAFLRWGAYHTRSDLSDDLLITCNGIWAVFAHAARIHDHDPYYECHVDEWQHKYKEKLCELNRIVLERVEKFDNIVTDDMPLAPDMEDMVLHPERYAFKPLEADIITDAK